MPRSFFYWLAIGLMMEDARLSNWIAGQRSFAAAPDCAQAILRRRVCDHQHPGGSALAFLLNPLDSDAVEEGVAPPKGHVTY